MSAVSDVNVTFADGVYPDNLNTLPYKADFLKDTEIACFRAHADVWRTVIQENLSTALIIESDADWDVNLKDQLSMVSSHMDGTNEAPYNRDWDYLSLGTCLETPREDGKHIISYHDPSAPEMSRLTEWSKVPLKKYYNDEELNIADKDLKRFIHKSPGTVCTTAYAVSRRGAMRLLYIRSTRGYFAPVDLVIRDMIWNNLLEAWSIIPPLMAQWKYKNIDDSDIGAGRVTKRSEQVFESTQLRRSALKSIEQFLWP